MTPAHYAEKHGAQFYLPYGGDLERPIMYYRRAYQVTPTGETLVRWQYLSHADWWEWSMARDPAALVKTLLPIEGATQAIARATGSAETTLTEAALRAML